MAINHGLSRAYARLAYEDGGISALEEILKGNVVLSDKLDAIEVALDRGIIDQQELQYATSRPQPEDFGLETDSRPTIVPDFIASGSIIANGGLIGAIMAAFYLLTVFHIVFAEGGGWGVAIIASMLFAPVIVISVAIGSLIVVGSINYVLPNAAAYRRFKNARSRHDTLDAARTVYAKARDIQAFYSASGPEFERLVARVFRRWGFQVEEVGGSNDGGIDLVIKKGQHKALVQCKAFGKPVGPAVVRELYGTLTHSDSSHAFLATVRGASESAKAWSADKPITILVADDFLRGQLRSTTREGR